MLDGSTTDERWMRRALELARNAAERGEVPVGCVIVRDGCVLGEASNRCAELTDPTAHAEMVALRQAFARAGEGRLPGAEVFVTLEPCFMCAGALLHARVRRIVQATRDPKFGACGSLARLPEDRRLNHRCELVDGPGQEESAEMLREFFRARR
ncbi:MAG: tRNA adenosine(34) deaminase TadA [Planctomycetota bacterium]